MGFSGGASGKEHACQCRRHEMWVPSLGQEDPLERAWQPIPVFLSRSPWAKEPSGLQSVELQKVSHD